MSQAGSLRIYFVFPREDEEAKCNKDMEEAFEVVKQYRGNPRWILPSQCLTHLPTEKDVFVFEEFKGRAFEKLKENSAKIIGAKCMLACVTAGDSIPPGKSPIFSEAMRGLMVCSTGLDEDTKKCLREKVHYMAGVYDNALRAATTHVVVGSVLTAKAIEGFKERKHMMKLEWVEAVWRRCHQDLVSATDPEFKIFSASVFNNLRMTTSGIPKREKDKLRDIITHHGGELVGCLEENKTNILITSQPVGEKFNAARKWHVKCVKPQWIYKCAESGRVVPIKDYILGDEVGNKISTPERGPVNLTSNFSFISAIANDKHTLSHMDETAPTSVEITLSQPATDIIDSLVRDMRDAGQFLDGCNIYLADFTQEQLEKLKKVLNCGGATRFDELTRSVTHIVTNAGQQNAYKEFGAYVLRIEWLAESIALKRPAPVEHYVVVDINEGPPSPLSKQGALLLSKPESAHVPEQEVLESNEEDLLDRYNLSQQGEPLSQRQSERNTPNKSARSSCSMKSELTCGANTFSGLKIYVSREIREEERADVEDIISKDGGVIVSKNFSGVADYAVVPVAAAALTQVTAREIVNLFFVKDCLLEKTIVPVQYYHLPVTWLVNSRPLEGCVVSVSQYTGSEREFVETLIDTLGGTVQAILARKPKPGLLKTTHLICVEPSGMKYSGALRWKLPIVHHDWLLVCAEKGTRVSEEPYLIGDSKLTTSNTTGDSTSVPDSARKKDLRTRECTTAQPPCQNNKGRVEEAPAVPPSAPANKSSSPVVAAKKLPLELTQSRRSNSQHSGSPGAANARRLPLELSQSTSPIQRLCSSPSAGPSHQQASSPFNKALERVRQMATPTSLDSSTGTATPTSPYGAFYGNDNPSPGTRKRLYRWMRQGADFPLDEQPTKPATPPRPSTPTSEYLSRYLKTMMAHRDEATPEKRPHLTPSQESTKNELINGLQRMREIEESYSKANNKISVSPVKSSAEAKMLIVAQSQPHTEIGWEDPTDREPALVCPEKVARLHPKVFMFSGLADEADSARKLIEQSGGQVSTLSCFDRNATHLVASSSMARAEKLMGSIAAGLWVLHPSYLQHLQTTKDVYALKDEDFEWGNPNAKLPCEALSKTVKECVESAYKWRIDLEAKKSPPFHDMKIILGLSESKRDSFCRLLEAGGGQVIGAEGAQGGDKVFCICDSSFRAADYPSYLRRNITCVSLLFVSDVILRKPNAAHDNLIPAFAQLRDKNKL